MAAGRGWRASSPPSWGAPWRLSARRARVAAALSGSGRTASRLSGSEAGRGPLDEGEAELPRLRPARARPRKYPGRRMPTPAAKPRVVKRKRRGGFGLRDAGTAALCVSAAGFFALGLNHDLYMRALPPSAQGLVWLAIGGALPAGLFGIVALLNADRAKLISKLLFGDETSSKVAPALVYALGALASFQGLPQAAG